MTDKEKVALLLMKEQLRNATDALQTLKHLKDPSPKRGDGRGAWENAWRACLAAEDYIKTLLSEG